MSDDLIKTLDDYARDQEELIDHLRAENERLREALRRIDGMATTICMKDDAGYGVRAESVMPIYETARAALESVMEPLWRHKKTGGTYEIVGKCQIEATNTLGVLYRNTTTGVVWVRPKEEFFDGRFEKVKLTLSAIRDLIKPGFSEERLWVDFIEEKLMMGDNFILIDDKKCLSYDDQQDMLKQNIEKWRNK